MIRNHVPVFGELPVYIIKHFTVSGGSDAPLPSTLIVFVIVYFGNYLYTS